MGIFNTGKKIKAEAKREARVQSELAAKAMDLGIGLQEQTGAAEQARSQLFGLFGAPGTYGKTPGTGTSGGSGGSTQDLFRTREGSSQAKGLLRYVSDSPLLGGEKIINPDALTEQVSQSAMFQQLSGRTAEAQQLLDREGPGWDRMHNSTYGQIVQGSARMLRDELREVRRNAAKGGAARRGALNQAQEIIARERANTMRVEQTWKANLALDSYVRENANDVLAQNYKFLDNTPQLRQSYMDTMVNVAEMFGEHALPAASAAAARSHSAQLTKIRSKTFLQSLAQAGITAVASMIPYVGKILGPALQQTFKDQNQQGAGGGGDAPASFLSSLTENDLITKGREWAEGKVEAGLSSVGDYFSSRGVGGSLQARTTRGINSELGRGIFGVGGGTKTTVLPATGYGNWQA